MAIESSATTLKDLNIEWPDDTATPEGAPIAEDDDHIRLYKNVLKLIFKGVTGDGFSVPITAIEDELNFCADLLGNLQDQLDAVNAGLIPVGGLLMYSGLFSNIPSNFLLADGANGTPNMLSKFVYGTTSEGQLEITGGSNDSLNISHSHTADHGHDSLTTDSDGNHNHDLKAYGSGSSGGLEFWYSSMRAPGTVVPTTTDGIHSHPVVIANDSTVAVSPTTENGINKNIPPYYKLAWIQRIS